ncbi:hypothetical protein GGQ94_001340 [Petrimonas sulfuriphila]|jgi:hypothetical protein
MRIFTTLDFRSFLAFFTTETFFLFAAVLS